MKCNEILKWLFYDWMYLITNFTYVLNALPFPQNYVKVTNSYETIVNIYMYQDAFPLWSAISLTLYVAKCSTNKNIGVRHLII